MLEGDVIAGTPGELSAKTGEDTILDVTLRGDVSDFLLGGLKRFKAWVELPELKGAEASNISDVPHCFKLIEMSRVVHKVKHEVVLHGNVKSLHLLGLGSTSLTDSAVDRVLGFHELVILGLNLVDNTWGVDVGTVAIPVDVLLRSG